MQTQIKTVPHVRGEYFQVPRIDRPDQVEGDGAAGDLQRAKSFKSDDQSPLRPD